ncbi:SRPBCC family protein [Aeromicrobium wangtongii]|uniref:SRPBCC family protein n=1 Tax=Aeromicrobium wangtongii TaxID=2969247 RepID=A0ABY5MBW0_9ACTN|nr:SRPBCC family protein [Aeromicrobium wangtongii]MCD9197168.1 SRPBCC family protein [Aeromicrobium wangtongii]MCL3818089.1 SRPBCC family protein [Aeromicrobium wangtongii]UUP14664.1 SRPBCC family protein [Aeromicrobium wangtongii]
MSSPQRVHVTHTFTSDPATVFEKLSEHENLGPVFGAKITRVKDGDTSRNGVGSTRSLKIGPLPAFHETTTVWEPHTLIEYTISKGSPLKGHWGRQILTPTTDGGTQLDYTIGFDMAVPGAAVAVGKVLQAAISKGLPKLTP